MKAHIRIVLHEQLCKFTKLEERKDQRARVTFKCYFRDKQVSVLQL